MKPGEHRVIESASNELFKTLKRLVSTKGIRRHRMAMFCGSKVVMETLARHPDRCVAVVTAKSRDVTFTTPPPRHLSEYQVTPTLFRELDVLGTAYPLLLVEAPPLSRWDPTETPPPGCTLLIPFQDAENVGAVIRSGVALGAKRVVLLEEAAHPYHPKAVRAASGLLLDAELLRGPSLADVPDTINAIPLSTGGKPLRDFEFPESFYLLPGRTYSPQYNFCGFIAPCCLYITKEPFGIFVEFSDNICYVRIRIEFVKSLFNLCLALEPSFDLSH